ncbi:MAG: PTS sugar transporter subunit IIA, partial [Candidatus Binatia bacterium]
MKILDILPQENVLGELKGKTKLAVLEELASALAARRTEISKDRLVEVLLDREKLGSTAIGEGIAIPHGMLKDRELIRSTGLSVVQVPCGVEWNPGE